MGCCEYKNLGRKYSEGGGEMQRADSLPKNSDNFNNPKEIGNLNIENSAFSFQIKKVQMDTRQSDLKLDLNTNQEYDNQKPYQPYIQLTNLNGGSNY